MSRKISAFITLILLIFGINYGIGYLAGKILTDLINNNIHQLLQVPLKVESVSVNPAFLFFSINGIHLESSESSKSASDVFYIKNITIDIEWMPLFVRKLIIEEMKIQSPRIVIRRDKKNNMIILPALVIAPLMQVFNKKGKYPPVTVENSILLNGDIGYQGLQGSIYFNDVTIEVSRFWRSPDRKKTEISFKSSGLIKGGSGSVNIAGDYYLENGKHSFAGNTEFTGIDVRRFYPFFKQSIPVKIDRGILTMRSKPMCSENIVSTVIHINIDKLKISPLPGKPKVRGIKVSMIQKFLDSTGGTMRSDLHITGTLQKPQINYTDMFAQIFVQKLQKDARKKIDKKASRAAKKISGIIEKYQKKKK